MREMFESIPEEFVSKTATYDQKVPITSVLDAVERFGAVVINNGGEYAGIVDQRAISRKGLLRLEEGYASGKFARKVPVVTDTTSIGDAINYFYHIGTKALPYMKGGRITGIVRRDAMLKAVLSMHLLSKVRVSKVMSTPAIAIDSDAGVEQARSALGEHRVNRLVVVSAGSLFGILTGGNITKYTARLRGSESRRTYPMKQQNARVGDICIRDPKTIDYKAGADDAIRQFVQNNISSLVVTRNGRPCGVVTTRDMFESIIQGMQAGDTDRILITGLSRQNEEYREELKSSISKMISKINRFAKVNVEYLALNVKQAKSNAYELRARVGLEKGGTVYASVTGFMLDRTLKSLERMLYKVIEEKKDVLVTGAREADSTYDREEE
ncbi:MAG: CBS domain-containing protein [Candidatus Marsarchaeota archaeon]|nr:CBS domain-containing protein [Candidatus Marsarchaeota archaeon]